MKKHNKWKMNRAGLLNFWYYDDEILDFSDGKLLLRGSNGSGKSVTMQSILPVLLDGKKSPDRLDPFGSKARKMEDYLLGEKDIVDRDERTGYLFIEYKREDTNQYITTGIGLQARRHKTMNFWGFAITDNRRIGKDFQLYEMENHAGEKQKIPLSRVQLENRIDTGGQVVRTQGDYMKLVNKYIFGFETIEAYEDLIKLLIQLRSPKLSKDFKPTVIYEILEAALPPLTDEDLRHLSDTIEHMDQTKQQIEQLEREHAAVSKLIKRYDSYNEIKLAEKARAYVETNKRFIKEETAVKEKIEQDQWREAVNYHTVQNVPLRELVALKRVYPAYAKDVWIVENSGVCSTLLDYEAGIPIVSTNGQFKLAALMLLDLLVAEGCMLHYAGDFDPEGLGMAQRLIDRYPDNVDLWHMGLVDYRKTSPVKMLSDEQIEKLNRINDDDLLQVVEEMRRIRKAGYQEALVEEMVADLRKTRE